MRIRDPRRPTEADLERTAASATPVPALLALQRSAGNAAVARLLARQGWDDARKEPGATTDGGWNAAARGVAGTLRVVVQGIKAGHQEPDTHKDTKEKAAGRAIVVVPDGADLSKDVEVLLFFHGMGNVGFRERTVKHAQRGDEGTVHDVEADRIPQQLAASGRNMVGVLPQGTDAAIFGIADPQVYVTEVLDLALGQLKSLRPALKSLAAIKPMRVVVAGHSGGGRAAYDAANKLTATKPANDAEWVHTPPLMLFDGINGRKELGVIYKMVERWLEADREQLVASADPKGLLARRKLKLRSTYTTTAVYTALNVGGTSYEEDVWKDGKKVMKELPDGTKVVETRTIFIAREASLKGQIKAWFAKDTELAKKDQDLPRLLQEQYVFESVAGGHEQTVGTGFTPERDKSGRQPAPAGVTGPSKKAGVPDYKQGSGHLEQGLSKLPPDAKIPPPPPPAPSRAQGLLDEVPETDEAYA